MVTAASTGGIKLGLARLLPVIAMLTTTASPIIIGHRGASGYLPEHTLASYRLAAEMGADFIEPDLVSTRDGQLIARHENEIGATTDAAEKFPARKATKKIDGVDVTGWFTEDFTLAEIKTLRAKERLPFRSHEFDGQFPVPTFDEVIALAQQLGRELKRPIGIYPETKHPSYFRSIGLALEGRLVESLDKHGWNARNAPVFIQSFETNLRPLHERTPVRLVQLIQDKSPTDEELRAIKSYADGIGPSTRLVIPANADGTLREPSDLIARAHAAGLLVHVWTLRREAAFLSPTYSGNFEAEFRQFRDLGADGIFTDFPDVGVQVFQSSSR